MLQVPLGPHPGRTYACTLNGTLVKSWNYCGLLLKQHPSSIPEGLCTAGCHRDLYPAVQNLVVILYLLVVCMESLLEPVSSLNTVSTARIQQDDGLHRERRFGCGTDDGE